MRIIQYQKCSQFATFFHQILYVIFCCGVLLSTASSDLWAAPRNERFRPKQLQQSNSIDASHVFLLPALESSPVLLTHTLDARLAAGDPLLLQIEAVYRLHNEGKDEVTAILRVAQPAGAVAAGRPLPHNIVLTLDGQPLPLQPAGEKVGQSVQVNFEADARRRLVLRYDLPLSATQTFDFQYPIGELHSWPNEINGWRVTIDFAALAQWLAPSDSWLQVGPRGWEVSGGRLEWLREEPPPNAEILFQTLHPQWVREIQNAREQIRLRNEPESYQWLGNLYARLFQAPNVATAVRERLYGQALAAYTQALHLSQERSRPDAVLAGVRYQLAALYRMRAIAADGAVDSAYVALMIAEAELALPALPQGPTRLELQSWVAQGLQHQLRTARLQQDWPQALLLTDRLAQLPVDVVDQNSLEEERRALILREVLQQLHEGNEEAAIALVGEEVLAGDLQPRPEYRTLFANWQITFTLDHETVSIDLLARPVSQRRLDSATALKSLLNAWTSAGITDTTLTEGPDGFRLHLDRLDARKRRILVQNTPQQPDWALLRSALLAAEQEIQEETRLLWRRTTQSIEVDFRAAADEWYNMAALLEREAAAATETAASGSAGSRAEASAQGIRNLLRAAQHRLEANRWQRLASDSTVQIVVGEVTDTAAPQRVWLLGLNDEPQRLSAHVENIDTVRLWLAVAIGIILSSLFAGVLWLLL